MKRVIIIIVVLAIVVGGYFAYTRFQDRASAAAGSPVRTATVEAGDIEVWVTGTGEIAPAAQTALAFNVTGNVGAVHVQVGDRVQTGDVLLELDPASLDASLVSAQADLISARQQLETLLESPTEQQLAQAQLAVVQAEQALEDAQRRLHDLQTQAISATGERVADAQLAAAQAEQALEDAQRRLRNVTTPSISAAEKRVADAQRVYDTATADLELTTVSQQATALHTAENNLNLATSQVQEVQARYDDCVEISCAERIFIEAQLTAAQNSYQSALDAFLSAKLQYETTLTNQQKVQDDAAEELEKAQNNLVAVQAGPKPLDVALAEAQLAVAEANLADAEETLAELQAGPTALDVALAETRVAVAEADLADAQKTLAELQAAPDPDDVAAARARLLAAQVRVDQTRLAAPFDATVMAVNAQVGDGVTPGRVAIVLADLRQLHVDTTVDELDIASVHIGQPVEMTLDALPGVSLTGEVVRIDLVPASGAATTEYPLRVELDAAENSVRVGMTAAVNILVDRKENALLVPNWALRLDPDTGEVFVTVEKAGGLTRVPVTLGLRDDAHSEVLAGLQAGDVVGIVVTPEAPSFRGPFGGGG